METLEVDYKSKYPQISCQIKFEGSRMPGVFFFNVLCRKTLKTSNYSFRLLKSLLLDLLGNIYAFRIIKQWILGKIWRSPTSYLDTTESTWGPKHLECVLQVSMHCNTHISRFWSWPSQRPTTTPIGVWDLYAI